MANPADDNANPEAGTGNTEGEESPFAGLSQEEAIARLEEAEKLKKRYESSSAEARRLHEENLALNAKLEAFNSLGNTGTSAASTGPTWEQRVKDKGYADADDIREAMAEAREGGRNDTLDALRPLFEEAQAHEKLATEVDGFADLWPKASAWMKDNPTVAADYQSLVAKGASAEAKKMLIYAYKMEHPGRGRPRQAREEPVNKGDAGIPSHASEGTGTPSPAQDAREEFIARIRRNDRDGARAMMIPDEKIVDLLRVANPGALARWGIDPNQR